MPASILWVTSNGYGRHRHQGTNSTIQRTANVIHENAGETHHHVLPIQNFCRTNETKVDEEAVVGPPSHNDENDNVATSTR